MSASRRVVACLAVVTALITGVVPSSALTVTPETGRTAVEARRYSFEIIHMGGYVVPFEASRVTLPMVYAYRGSVYRPTPDQLDYPAVARIDRVEADPQELIAAAESLYAALVEPKGGWGRVPVEDAPVTLIHVRTPVGERRAYVYVPWFDGRDLERYVPEPAASARRMLYAAMGRAIGLQGPTTSYRPTRVEFWPIRSIEPLRTETVTPLRRNPTATTIAGCLSLLAGSVPSKGTGSSLYRTPDGETTMAFLRPVLPGERACVRLNRWS